MKNLKSSNISNYSILIFILKIWIFTNIISAFFYALINDYDVNGVLDIQILFKKIFWQFVLLAIYFGSIFSLPAMLILALLVRIWTNNKLILTFISIILVFSTFYYTGFMSAKNSKSYILYPPIVYSLVISSLILIINMGKKSKSVN